MPMTFARIVSRVAGAVIAFIVAIGYCGILALVPQIVCEGPASSPYLGANVFAAVLLPLLALSLLAGEWRDKLRWLSLPLLLLLPLAALAVWPFLDTAMHSEIAACQTPPGAGRGWHAWWAAGHLAVLAAVTLVTAWFWRPAR